MPQHGRPDSRVRNSLAYVAEKVVIVVIVGVIGGIVGTWAYNHYFGAEQAVVNEHEISADKDQIDQETPPAIISIDQEPPQWAAWLSDDLIDIPPGQDRRMGNNGSPNDGREIAADMPFTHDFQTSQVSSGLAFTITGNHNTPVRVTKIRAVIDDKQPPPSGTVFYAVPQGATDKQDFAIDFGSTDLDARMQNDDGVPMRVHYLDRKAITLNKGESVSFKVTTVAPIYGVNIAYHLELTFDNSSAVSVRSNSGKPFKIVSYPIVAQRGYITVADQNDGMDDEDFAIYPCSWPEQCRNNALGRWPFRD